MDYANGGVWITKTDGAGETDIEGEKGAFSDAFKRAAVHHGVARYLYDDKPGKAKPRSKSVVAAVLDGVDVDYDNRIAPAEAAIRKAMNAMIDYDLDPDVVKGKVNDAIFDLTSEEKLALWGRFDSTERSAMKKSGVAW